MFPVMNIKTDSLGHHYETVRLVRKSSGHDHKGTSSTLLNFSVTAASVWHFAVYLTLTTRNNEDEFEGQEYNKIISQKCIPWKMNSPQSHQKSFLCFTGRPTTYFPTFWCDPLPNFANCFLDRPVVDTRCTEKQRTETQSRKSYEITEMEKGV